MSLQDDRIRIRSGVVDRLRAETVGPGIGVRSELASRLPVLADNEPPRARFGVGVLFPQGQVVATQEDVPNSEDGVDEEVPEESLGEAGSEGKGSSGSDPAPDPEGEESKEADPEIGRANEFLPSALGISALAAADATIRVEASFIRYERVSGSVSGSGGWRAVRCPVDFTVHLADFRMGASGYMEPVDIPTGSDHVAAQVRFLVRQVRETPAGIRSRLVTCSLLNNSPAERHTHESIITACELSLSTEGETGPAFLPYPAGLTETDFESLDRIGREEEGSLRLLYRKRLTYAVGHGTAADWDEPDGEVVRCVRATPLPTYEVKPVVPTEAIDLKMLELSGSDDESLSSASLLIERYEEWIDERFVQIEADPSITPELEEAARRHVKGQRETLDRMKAGLALLRTDRSARKAFTLMNRSMMHQQIRNGISVHAVREWEYRDRDWVQSPLEPPPMDDPERKWRPFQLAFILANLRAFVDPESSDRDIVDVIWFPTGGGKTEAYLGLAAFAILLRRLRNPADSGTTVLTRYTLRLLTTQQFQRTATLACALELLRRDSGGALGAAPITLGLWVGGEVTPNRHNEAVTNYREIHSKGPDRNKFVLLSCPWCGSQMGPVRKPGRKQEWVIKGYTKIAARQEVRLVCPDHTCEFSGPDGLPVEVVDEALYDSPPTILISTVDKFAQLPIRPRCAQFLGWAEGKRASSPPDLIIQDELHLISGPLGTMVGLYETVILELSRAASGRNAKIVASTATVARAEEQVRSLYARPESALFPPQGLEWGDSFFAREASEEPGRQYVGLFGTGYPSQQTALTRVASALLEAPDLTAGLLGPKPKSSSLELATDPYWTLVAYFNSTRELGAAATLFTADIREYMKVSGRRHGTYGEGAADTARELFRWLNDAPAELTGRVSSSEINSTLDQLFVTRTPSARPPVDVCLATNMIQVGLDVQRLGLMLVAGQPKTAAEYIQATSRVGRSSDAPGLVVVMLNPGKPRDRSHYESFRSFHQRLYSMVEPTSVTPFAAPARQRALHALIVALVRILGGKDLAQHPDSNIPDALLDRIRSIIGERVRAVDPAEEEDTMEEMEILLASWLREPPEEYGDFFQRDRTVVPLMYVAGTEVPTAWDEPQYTYPWAVPGSMRSVSPDCELRILPAAGPR